MKPIEELPFIAGHIALDFVNTAEERGHPEADDALRTPGDLRAWGARQGLLSADADPAHDDGPTHDDDPAHDNVAELARAIDARELLYRLLYAHVHGTEHAPPDREHLAHLVAEAYAAGELAPDPAGGLKWRWSPADLATARHVAVTSALELFGETSRLKQCPGEHCGWFFLDATKRGNRRWCSMGECGQDAKVARRRARRTAGP